MCCIIAAGKKVMTLLEHMFEGEIEPLDEGNTAQHDTEDTNRKLSLNTVT